MESTSGPRNAAAGQRQWSIATVVIVVVVFVAGVGGAIFFGVVAVIKDSDAYQLAVAKLLANAAATEALGAPIEMGIPRGSLRISGPSGDAQLEIPVEGTKARGRIYMEATRSLGQWNADRILLQIDGRPGRIDLNSTATTQRVAAVVQRRSTREKQPWKLSESAAGPLQS